MYKIIYKKEINSDLNKIDQTIKNQIFKKLEKISINPEIWDNLSWNLVWCKKVYVNNKKIRIIYKILDEMIEILVISIWKRENK